MPHKYSLDCISIIFLPPSLYTKLKNTKLQTHVYKTSNAAEAVLIARGPTMQSQRKSCVS